MSQKPLALLAGVALLGVAVWALRPAGEPEAPAAPARPTAAPASAPRTGDRSSPARDEMLKGESEHYEQLRRQMDAAQALAMADDGHTRFVRGNLFQEREVIALRSLMRLGQRDLAETRARRFLQRYPQGPNADVVRGMMGL